VHDEAYFSERVEPWIDGDRVVYRGSVGPAERDDVLGSAAALLHPIHFDEPFGLSVAEAMVCGTPVIAYARGSMPELIEDGSTGFLVDGVDGAVAALARLGSLDRAHVATMARARFDVERMVDGYLRVYEALLG
jgi:glycosyltransferase involved in cell wall biosynthesis